MRAVLALSVVLLVLTLALNHARTFLAGPPPETRLADRALEVVVGAKGPLLPEARLGTGPERIGEAIRLGDRTLPGTGSAGLRAAFLGPDFALRAERCFDVGGSPDGARALRVALEEADDDTLLVLGSSGRLEPGGADARGELERALTLLGARASPGTATPESWALIALRLERRWVPLAEGYSTDSGVALAFVVAPELESYAGFRGDFTLVRAGERREIDLAGELPHATGRTPGVLLARGATVQGQPMNAVLLPPGRDAAGAPAPGHLSWSGVELGAGSWLVTWLGLADGANADSDGVALEVRIDGEVAKRQEVRPGLRWKVLLLPLRAFAGRRVELELAVDPLGDGAGDALLLGMPTLCHGYERSPLQR